MFIRKHGDSFYFQMMGPTRSEGFRGIHGKRDTKKIYCCMCNIKRVKRFLHIHTIIELPTTGGFKWLGKGPHKKVVCLHFFPANSLPHTRPKSEEQLCKKEKKRKKENQHSEVTKYIFECKC